VQTGASPAIYGLLACLVVELIQAWKVSWLEAGGRGRGCHQVLSVLQSVANRMREAIKLLLIILISLGVGLLPYVDNFSHLGGFIFGLLRQVFGARDIILLC
jgi:membrane associated rhomboid family serine protease